MNDTIKGLLEFAASRPKIIVGDEVVCVDPRCKYSLGEVHEGYGYVNEVYDTGPDKPVQVYAQFNNPKSGRNDIYVSDAANFVQTSYVLRYKIPEALIKQPKFKVDDIVYAIGESSVRSPSIHFPVLGSEYETDMKIAAIIPSKLGYGHTYRAISPIAGLSLNFHEKELILGVDRIKHIHKDYAEYTCGINAGPFFNQGEKVIQYEGALHNVSNTVSVPVTNIFLQFLTKLN